MSRAHEFVDLSRRELARLLREGHPIDPRALDETIYRGTSLGIPGWVERLAWKIFAKTFHRDPVSGVLRGWNVRVEQHGIAGPLVLRRRHGHPVTFGHFHVVGCAGMAMPIEAPGLLLDYGRGGNPRLDPSGRVRDPIVALTPGSADVLLGWSYLDLGFARLGTPSYFLLERAGALDHVAAPPRS